MIRLSPLLLALTACDAQERARPEAEPDDAPPAEPEDTAGESDATPLLARPYLVVTTDALAPAAEALAAYRAAAGYDARVVLASDLAEDPADLVSAVPAALAELAAASEPGAPLLLALLGDAPADGEPLADLIPALPCTNDLGGCYTDNGYGDLDGDGLPEAAVGRIPARTLDQAAAYVEKIKRYEGAYSVGLWNRRMVLYAGYSGFGADTEELLETLILKGLASVDPAFDILGLYDNPLSPFYYTPFEEKVVDLLSEGNVLTMYIGHGSAAYSAGLDRDALEQLSCDNRMPILTLFACSIGQYAEAEDSIAETALWTESGPIAAFAGTDITHPYANGVLPYEVQRAVLGGGYATLGEALRGAKLALFSNDGDEIREILDLFAAVYGVADTAATLEQHVDLYNLMGDPALALRLPAGRVVVEDISGSTASGSLVIRGTTPGIEEGTAWVTLEVPRDVAPTGLEPIDAAAPDPAVVQANWAEAIDTALIGAEVPVSGGSFEATLEVAPLPGGTYYVKVYAQDGVNDAFGFTEAP